MKRIKRIIEAFITTRQSPSKSIMDAWEVVTGNASRVGLPNDTETMVKSQRLIADLVESIVVIAKDMEKPAKAESESAT